MALTYVKSSGLDTTGDFVANSLTLTANVVSGNAQLGNSVTANYFVGNGSLLTGLPGGNVSFVNDSFTGDGTTTQFTLTATPATKNQTTVNYNGATVLRGDYSITGNVVTFSSAPANGASIEITTVGMNLVYTSMSTVAGANVTGQVANSLVAGTVYTNAQPNITSVGTLTSLSVSGNVTGSYFSGNGSLLTSIAGANVTGQVANSLVSGTVYTNAQPNITSLGTLTSLSIAGLLSESFGTKTGATGTVAHDVTANNTFYHTSPAANFTANFTNVPTTSSKIIVVTLVIAQGSTPYVPSTMQIDGTTQTVSWLGGSAPTGTASKYDVISYSLFRVGSAWTIFGSASSFG